MKCVYSFVVDGHPRFLAQARIFLTTLIAAGVSPTAIRAHYTPTADVAVIDLIDQYNIPRQLLLPILDQTYCNKIAQLPLLCGINAEFVILCDTDLAFLSDPGDLCGRHVIRAAQVDLPNPPWEILEQIRLAIGLEAVPHAVKPNWSAAPTFPTNFNGGLYIIPAALVESVGRQWYLETAMIRGNLRLLGDYGQHSDQVGLAMALLRLGLEFDLIPIEYNFPYHLAEITRCRSTIPKIIHYHDKLNSEGYLLPSSDIGANYCATAVNALLRTAKAVEYGIH
jgi:hypothetical protein